MSCHPVRYSGMPTENQMQCHLFCLKISGQQARKTLHFKSHDC